MDAAALSGDTGYWHHWWTMLHDQSTSNAGAFTMETVAPRNDPFVHRSWPAEFDREVRDYALHGAALTGRAIVPPATIGAPVEPLIDLALERGFRVSVLACDAHFTLYNGVAAVVTEPDPTGTEQHSLVRTASTVSALTLLFDVLWKSAIPWQDATGEAPRIIELLGQGRTDEQIAHELGVSARTVSRRISEMMRRTGAGSRFALGLRFGRSGLWE